MQGAVVFILPIFSVVLNAEPTSGHQADLGALRGPLKNVRRMPETFLQRSEESMIEVTWDATGVVYVNDDAAASGLAEGDRVTRRQNAGNLGTAARAGEREYHVMKSTKATVGNTRDPAIIMLHGAYSDSSAMASESTVRSLGPAEGYTVAYVDAAKALWNSGSCGYEGHDDAAYIALVAQDLVEKFNADPARIYLAGISNGASMAVRTLCEHPERFAGLAAAHGSLESRDGVACASRCAGGVCAWDKDLPGCGPNDWETSLEEVFSCDGLKGKQIPIFLTYGLESYADSRGGVYPPKMSFPPVGYMVNHLAQAYGCGAKQKATSNGTAADWTRCHTFEGCSNTLTNCVSNAGDWWYGSSDADIEKICLHKGYSAAECTPEQQYADWGPQTDTMDMSRVFLDFFTKAGAKHL